MKKDNRIVLKELLSIIIYLTIIQLLFIGIKQGVFCFYPETLYSRSMVMMFTMIVCLIIMIIYCRRKKCSYNFFPKVFGYLYIIITIIAVIFYVVTLFWVKTFSFENSLMFFYGSIVTPVFEELLFRGIIWTKLNELINKEWKTYLVVTVLFALWHIGYAVGIYLWSGGNLFICIVMKVIFGAVFGLIMGAIRCKTKNCYLGILVHGILNIFG